MSKKTFTLLFSFFVLVVLVSTGHTQGPKKTITLPNGDVVCDINGDWDALYSFYGVWSDVADVTDVLKITQKGAVFVGVKQIGTVWASKGQEGIRGELTKNGFKKVQVLTASEGYLDCTCKICEDGNKIKLDDGEKMRVTLTRR